MQGRRVLLAEDNLINQKVAQMMLTSLGMVVEVASNGQEAFQLVSEPRPEKERQFQCVLMDMAMPVMGGVDATLVGSCPCHAVHSAAPSPLYAALCPSCPLPLYELPVLSQHYKAQAALCC